MINASDKLFLYYFKQGGFYINNLSKLLIDVMKLKFQWESLNNAHNFIYKLHKDSCPLIGWVAFIILTLYIIKNAFFHCTERSHYFTMQCSVLTIQSRQHNLSGSWDWIKNLLSLVQLGLLRVAVVFFSFSSYLQIFVSLYIFVNQLASMLI